MSKVTVQEALKAAIEALEYVQNVSSFDYDRTLRLCKTALSELDKREPVCNVEGTWLWLKLMGYCKAKGLAPTTQNELFAIAGEAHKLYTSPQPYEWVGLDKSQIKEIINRPNMWIFGESIDFYKFAEALNEELKQLNTKG